MEDKENKIKKHKFYSKIFLFVGLFLTFSAIGSYFSAKSIVKSQVHQNVLLANNSKAYGYWINPPAKITRKYFLFNVANPDEVQKGIAKPKLVEQGPYCFDEFFNKNNVKFLDDDTVRFDPVDTIHFNPDPICSKGSLDDPITFLNIPAVGMIESLMHGKTNGFTYAGVNSLLGILGTKLFETKTVVELISGFKDPLLEVAKLFVPKLVTDNKFSLLHGKNGTIWQNYSMNTGYTDPSHLGEIKTWDDAPKLNLYDNKYANMINGSDGTIFTPFRTRNDTVYAFSPDMCRSYPLTYLKDMKVNDVTTYAYHLPKNVFFNSTMNPDSACFCGEENNKCLGNGVHNISRCYGGVSGFISQPHFLNAESKFLEEVEGMKPIEELHDFILRFEPTTGVALTGNVRLQISFYIFNNIEINLVKNVKSVLLPMVWFDEVIELDPSVIIQLKQVALITQLCIIIPLALLGLGAFWLIVAVGLRTLASRKRNEYIEIKNDDKTKNESFNKSQKVDEIINEKTELIN